MFDVQIYGEIVPFQDSWILENGYFNLSALNEQLAKAEGKPLLVRINSYGGDVEEGFAIYQALRRYATENKVEITTRCDGRCASIATVIFLAGDKRIVNEYISPFVHNAWTYAVGDAKELQRLSSDLEAVNIQIANHYASHTNLTVEEARELMDAETAISSEECLNIRFATEIEKVDKPKALLKFKNQISNKMSNKKKAKSIFAKIEALLEGKSFKNLDVFTETNDVLDFYELGEGDVPKVGDKAKYKEDPAEGTFKLADAKTQYKFEAGVLTEIVEDSGDDAAAKDAEIADLKAQIETLKGSTSASEKDQEIKALKAKIQSFKNLSSDFKAALENDGKSSEKKKKEKKEFTNFKFVR
jgi:ATP-dependent Clp protease protease subunit